MFFKHLIENAKTIITKKYFCFEGRAARKEFWMWVLVIFVLNLIFNFIPKIGGILSLILALGTLLPSLGVTARRLHDLGKSGWMQLLGLIPFVGGVIVLVLCIPSRTDNSVDQKGYKPVLHIGCILIFFDCR